MSLPRPVLRLATPADTPRIASIGGHAFRALPIIPLYYPSIRTSFAAYLRARTRFFLRHALLPTCRLLVAVDPATDTVMGFALWCRCGDSRRAAAEFAHPLLTLERAATEAVEGVRAWAEWCWGALTGGAESAQERREREERLRRVQTWQDEFWARLGMRERWFLMSLVVSPEFRRRGVARELVAWGVQRAREEGVVAVLEATREGRRQYEKQGFVVVGEERNVVEGVELGAMMVCEPEKFEVH